MIRIGALTQIINHYGFHDQHKKAIEECQELIEAIDNHLLENTEESRTHLIDEIADVSVMLEQLKLMNGCTGEVAARVEYKIDRQIKRMEVDKRW